MSVVNEVASPVETAIEQPAEQGRKSLKQNIAALSAGQLFTWAMTLSWTLVVPRLLGAGQVGLIITGMSIANILQLLLGAGTANYITREIVVSPERAARLVSAATLGRLALFPVFAGATFAWSLVAGYGSHENVVLYLCSAATAVTLLSEPILSYFQATERMQYMALGNVINKTSQGLGGIVLVVLGFGALGFAWCWVVTASLVVVLCIRWIQRYVSVRWRTSWHDIRDVARGSAIYWTGGVFFTIYAWIDTAMLSVMTTPKVVAWYGVPMRLWGTMLVIPSIFSTAWLPRMVKAHQQSKDELISVSRAPIELVFLMSLPIATLVAIGATPVIHTIYGSSYDPAVGVLVILGLNLIPMYLNIMLAQICIASKRFVTWTWLMVGASVFNPVINLFLIPLTQHRYGNGAIGAAIALALTEVAIDIAAIALVGRKIIGLSTLWRGLRMAVPCGAAWLASYLLRHTPGIVGLSAGALVLVVLVVCVGITAPERARGLQELRSVLAKIPGVSSRLRPPPSEGAS
jgi:O-antigen/teichoic acid export membrane protein